MGKHWDEQKRQGHSPIGRQGLTEAQQRIIDAIPLREEIERPLTTIEKVRAAGHQHGEAFCLMTYACAGTMQEPVRVPGQPPRFTRTAGCGHREIFWNSRDGVTPFAMACPSCGGDLQHVNWQGDRYAPDHKPHFGQGIWRDGTPDEAERIIRKRVELYPPRDAEEAARIEAAIAEARAGGEQSEFRKGWPMFARHGLEG